MVRRRIAGRPGKIRWNFVLLFPLRVRHHQHLFLLFDDRLLLQRYGNVLIPQSFIIRHGNRLPWNMLNAPLSSDELWRVLPVPTGKTCFHWEIWKILSGGSKTFLSCARHPILFEWMNVIWRVMRMGILIFLNSFSNSQFRCDWSWHHLVHHVLPVLLPAVALR